MASHVGSRRLWNLHGGLKTSSVADHGAAFGELALNDSVEEKFGTKLEVDFAMGGGGGVLEARLRWG